MRSCHIYIMASGKNGTLYIGVTNDLQRRVGEHKEGEIPGFTQRYHIHKIVYHEEFSDMQSAIKREKQLKRWKREWKIRLIEQNNPCWNDLFDDF